MAFLNKSGVERLWAHIVSLVGDKVDKVEGMGLSTNDYTTAEKTKLAGIIDGANKTTIDNSLTQSGAAADAKVVGDLWNLIADDSDAEQLLQELDLTSSQRRSLTDEGGTVLTD